MPNTIAQCDINSIARTMSTTIDAVCTLLHSEQCAVASNYELHPVVKVECILRIQAVLTATLRNHAKAMNLLNDC